MPASNIDSYLQEARNNFDAVRPAPISFESNQSSGQCPNVYVSANCYYGYQSLKSNGNNHVDIDCEMVELGSDGAQPNGNSTKAISKKRCAEENVYPPSKRVRDEVQKEKIIEPETKEKMKLDDNTEDLTESLYWNIHGGNMFDLIQCL